MIEQIERVAIRSRSPILLNGPTSAGKSFLARRITAELNWPATSSAAVCRVNCAAAATMSALFGHVKGAFTGAKRSVQGLLRSADGGMLFLTGVKGSGRG